MGCCSWNSFGAAVVIRSELLIFVKIIKHHDLHLYTQWEQQIEEAQVATTTRDDGKMAAPLTFVS